MTERTVAVVGGGIAGIGAASKLAAEVDASQGAENTWYCGSYLREPFVHEPALASGLDVVERIIAADKSADRAPTAG